jgi:beta-lactamase class A
VGVSSAVGAGSCNATPPAEVADRLAAAGAVAAGRAGTAAVAVADATTGELLGNPASAVPMRAASIIKVVIAMATLDRAEREHRELTPSEAADLRGMIRSSDNGSTSRLWASLGGPDVIRWVRDITGVRSTEPPAVDHEWGFSTTTAHDMAVILGALVRGRVLSSGHRALLLAEMRHVDGEQAWGVGAVAPAAAVKNGWYADGGQAAWRVHSVGVVDDRWIVVVMTTYPTGQGMGYGQETCRLVAQRVLPPR